MTFHIEHSDRMDPRTSPEINIFKDASRGNWAAVFSALDSQALDPNLVSSPENLGSPGGETLLSIAAAASNPDACRELIDRGANPALRTGHSNRPPIVEAVRCRGGKIARLNEVVKLLASTVNDRDSSGKTALMFASVGAGLFGAKRGNIGLIKLLLDIGADPFISDNHGTTALMHAVLSNKKSNVGANDEVISLLKETMISFTAKQFFEKHCSYEFLPTGKLEVKPR